MSVMTKTLTKHSIEQITSPAVDGTASSSTPAGDSTPMENDEFGAPLKKMKTEFKNEIKTEPNNNVEYVIPNNFTNSSNNNNNDNNDVDSTNTENTENTENNNNNNNVNNNKKVVTSEKIVSYTEMIARAIFSCPSNMSTLQDIYNYLSAKYPILANRGKSWKNSVRHTLSLNEWFVKIPRMDNGKCCYWSVHPVYLHRFKKGDFQKQRKSTTCKLRNAARTLEELQYNLNNSNCHMSGYYPPVTDMSGVYYPHALPSWPVCRTSVENMQQQQSYYNAYPPHLHYAAPPPISNMSADIQQTHLEHPDFPMMTSSSYMKPTDKLVAMEMNCKQHFANEGSFDGVQCVRTSHLPEPMYSSHRDIHPGLRYHSNSNNNSSNSGSFSPAMGEPISPISPISPTSPVNELAHLQMQMRMENAM